ncbi:MAG: AAA family ATPase [Alphaproteobacteria bacterium]|nr:AAA family ATPase [Alphaproteobacteria bacterium]
MTKPSFVISDQELNTLMDRYTRDFTVQDRAGRFDPISGRDKEVEKLTLILVQRLRKNALILGPAGVGKTALFIGFAQRLNKGEVPDILKGAKLIELEMSMIGAGSASRADLEGRLIPIVKGVAERNASGQYPPIIFCIDEIHQLMLAFKASSYSGLADILKPYLTTGDLLVIGATTREEYDEYVKAEPAIDRRFQKITLQVPDLPLTMDIIKLMRPNFEKHYGFQISDRAIERVVLLTDRYIKNRNNPDKSILCLDQACAHASLRGVKDQLDDESIAVSVAAEAGINHLAL